MYNVKFVKELLIQLSKMNATFILNGLLVIDEESFNCHNFYRLLLLLEHLEELTLSQTSPGFYVFAVQLF